MKKLIILLFISIGMLSLSFTVIKKISKNSIRNKDIVPNMIIVKYKSDASLRLSKSQALKTEYDGICARYQVSKIEKIFPSHSAFKKVSNTVDLSAFYIVSFYSEIDPAIVAKEFEKSSLVEYAEPKYIRHLCITPNDTYYSSQYALKKVYAEQAWDVNQGDSNVVIGIIDTGIDWIHPDLAANVWINKREIPNNNIDDDGNGFIDDIRGWDFGGLGSATGPTPDNNPNEDAADHGSHVAGIASAVTNNNIGVAGLGFRCKVMAVKVTQNNKRSQGPPDVLFGYEGIVYAADNGAQIINCSWGGGGYSRYENEIIQYATQKGSLVVASAGNYGTYQTSFYPASYPHVLSVTSTNQLDQRSSFSNFGPYVDVSAPGSSILSTWFGNIYMNLDGTSMAAPLAAGLAGLVKSKFPNYLPDQVAERIRITSDKIDSTNQLYLNMLGYGRINAYKALTLDLPSVRMVNVYINDTLYGNGNGLMEPGEKVLLKMDFINYLSPTKNLTMQLKSESGYAKVNKNSFNPGLINTLQVFNNNSKSFEIEIDNTTPYNFVNTFTLYFQDENYYDFQQFVLTVNPSFANTNINNISMTITSAGNIGFNDYPDNLQGNGFRYKSDPYNILFEGALMFGTSFNQLSNCARGTDQNTKDNHFKTIKSIQFFKGEYSDEESVTTFNDDLNASKSNIQVRLNSFAFKTQPYDNFIILNYQLKNNNANGLNNFYSGIYFDWDIGVNGDLDIVQYNTQKNLCYIYNQNNNPSTYVGVALLNNFDKINFCPILNNDTSPENFQVYDGFTPAEKYRALSSRLTRLSAGPGDISMVIGAGPFNIPANGVINMALVILAGGNLSEIENSLNYAKEKYAGITVSTGEISKVPDKHMLFQNFPNPFNPSTSIKYNLKDNGNIKIQIYDINGELIKEISKQNLSAGEYFENIDMKNFSSGTYFYRINIFKNSGEKVYTQTRRMVYLK